MKEKLKSKSSYHEKAEKKANYLCINETFLKTADLFHYFTNFVDQDLKPQVVDEIRIAPSLNLLKI